MAKQKKAAPATAAPGKEKKMHPYFESLKKRAAKLSAGQKIGILISMVCLVDYFISKHGVGVGMAALYQFANDGKVSGRMQGDVKMRNGRSRAFTVPSLVRNAYTTIARTTFSSFSSLWNSLTPAEQLSWNNSSGAFVSDRFAVPHLLKGKQLYVALNCNLFYAGQAPITTAPFISGVSGFTSLAVSAVETVAAFDLDFTPTPTLAGQTALIFATALQNPGVFRPSQSKFRLIGTIPPGTATTFDALAMWNTKFGALVAGTKVFVQIKTVANTSGLESAITQADTIVT